MPTIRHARASVTPRRPPTDPTRSLRSMAAHLLCVWMARACHLEIVTGILPDSGAGCKEAALMRPAMFVSPLEPFPSRLAWCATHCGAHVGEGGQTLPS